eukprot:613614-Pyramimonas_sp.AAC.1
MPCWAQKGARSSWPIVTKRALLHMAMTSRSIVTSTPCWAHRWGRRQRLIDPKHFARSHNKIAETLPSCNAASPLTDCRHTTSVDFVNLPAAK